RAMAAHFDAGLGFVQGNRKLITIDLEIVLPAERRFVQSFSEISVDCPVFGIGRMFVVRSPNQLDPYPGRRRCGGISVISQYAQQAQRDQPDMRDTESLHSGSMLATVDDSVNSESSLLS